MKTKIVIYKCLHCKKLKGDHKAVTLNCPWGGRKLFPDYEINKFFEPDPKTAKEVEIFQL